VQSQLSEGSVLSGHVPPVAGVYIPRESSGLTLARLPAHKITALLPGGDKASDPGWGGGTGKTSLASALARSCWESGTARLVAWISATSRDSLLTGYAGAAQDLGLVGPVAGYAQLLASRFLEWLASTDQPWLVVLDDLANPGIIDGLWPAGNTGWVVVTAAAAEALPSACQPKHVEVGAFSPREALDYLSAALGVDHSQRSGAPDLADDLCFLPLALSLAGAFMGRVDMDCRQYRTLFTERRQPLAHAFPDHVSSSLAATWSLAHELADQLQPRGLAGRILILLSTLTPHGIPGAIFSSQAARSYLTGQKGTLPEPAVVRAALQNLAVAGLVTVDERSLARTVRIHEMLQLVTRYYISDQEYYRAARAAADALEQTWSAGSLPLAVTQALRDCAASVHASGGPSLWTPNCHPTLVSAGQSLDADGLPGPAVTYWQSLLSMSQLMLGPEDPVAINARWLLAQAYEASGRLDDAIASYEALLRDREQALGSHHPDILGTAEQLTRSYVAAGRGADAVRLAEKAFIGCKQDLGPDHQETLGAQANLANIYLLLGQHDEASTAFEYVLAGRERALGQAHLDTIATRASLGSTYQQAGRFKNAIAVGKRVLEDRERLQGADHLDTVTARASLAAAYRGARKFKDALRLYEQVMADRERLQGTDHPDAIVTRSDLALAYLSTQKLALAIKQYEQAAGDSERVLGHSDPITTAIRESLQEATVYARSVLGIDLRSTHGLSP
jgi:tetratricopeptide (TPR) repeat protein